MTPENHALHHIALGAHDVEKLAAFYSTAFHLRELGRHHYPGGALRSVWLDIGGTVLMIEHTLRERERSHGIDAGLFLVALRVSHAERIELENHFSKQGCPRESSTEHTSYFRDPEGNRFAVSTYPLG
jgi:catechol-2,3-dioxygenase